jgi:hypothetical protein
MDPDPNPANLLHQVMEQGSLFMFEDEAGYKF